MWNATPDGTNSYWTNSGTSAGGGGGHFVYTGGTAGLTAGYGIGSTVDFAGNFNSQYGHVANGVLYYTFWTNGAPASGYTNSGGQNYQNIQGIVGHMMSLDLNSSNSNSNNDYWGLLNNASTAQSYATNGIGLTLGTTAQVSNDLVNAGKMIKTPNIFKTYNLYRSNGYLNGNKYISGAKFLKNVKTINAVNSSKVVKGVAYAGLAISMAQFYESHHPGYISRGIVSYASGFIPYIGPAVSLGIDNTDVNYWNIWTWGAMNRGSNHYDYLNPEN